MINRTSIDFSLTSLSKNGGYRLKFEWDPEKNDVNQKKHGVSFEEAETVFEDEQAITIYDEQHSDEEDRFKIIGISRKLRELTVCHCCRNGDEIIRIISAWRARKNEIELYERGLYL
jgi:uncharacterized DUF497 family protein